MAISQFPHEESNLAAAQVEAFDLRRDLGHALLVIAGQFALVSAVLMLWVTKDLTYAPGWPHPMGYYFAIAFAIIAAVGIAGFFLRRGTSSIG